MKPTGGATDCEAAENQTDENKLATIEKEGANEKVGDSHRFSVCKNVETIEFAHSAGNALGISIKGGIDHPYLVSKDEKALDAGIFVVHLYAGGVASEDGRLRLGDRIIAVNGVSVENVKQNDFLKILNVGSKCNGTLQLTVKHNEALRKRLHSRKTTLPTIQSKTVSSCSDSTAADATVTAPVNPMQLLLEDAGNHFEVLQSCANPNFLKTIPKKQEPKGESEAVAEKAPTERCGETSSAVVNADESSLSPTELASAEEDSATTSSSSSSSSPASQTKEEKKEEAQIEPTKDLGVALNSEVKNPTAMWRQLYLPAGLVAAAAAASLLGLFLARKRIRGRV